MPLGLWRTRRTAPKAPTPSSCLASRSAKRGHESAALCSSSAWFTRSCSEPISVLAWLGLGLGLRLRLGLGLGLGLGPGLGLGLGLGLALGLALGLRFVLGLRLRLG